MRDERWKCACLSSRFGVHLLTTEDHYCWYFMFFFLLCYRGEIPGPRPHRSQTALPVHPGRTWLGEEVSNRQACSKGRQGFTILWFITGDVTAVVGAKSKSIPDFWVGMKFCCLSITAAAWCQLGGGTLSSAGRGAASAEVVGGSKAGYPQHQLCGHTVRRQNICSPLLMTLNYQPVQVKLTNGCLNFFPPPSSIHIVFSSLKKVAKFEVVFSVSLSNYHYVLHLHSFKNMIGDTT